MKRPHFDSKKTLEELKAYTPELPSLAKNAYHDFLRINKIDAGWFILWIFIYVSFLIIDIFFKEQSYSNILKYSGIILCVVYAHKKYPKDHKLTLALFFTFLADTMLVWTPYEYLGVLIFCIAQFLHTLRLSDNSKSQLAIYGSGLVVFYGILRILHIDALYAITASYAIQLFLNFLLTKKNYHLNKDSFQARCAFYGYTLFLGCDICVGLRHLILDGILPDRFLPLIAFMVWVFYYPSQVLLSNSSRTKASISTRESSKLQKSSH